MSQRSAGAPGPRGDGSSVPVEVTSLEGVYTGEWTVFGLDAAGQVVPYTTWTDTVTAENATVEGDRAFVTCTDEMVFASGQTPPRSYTMIEGYYLRADGSLGDYFTETFGVPVRMHRLAADTWAYASPATPQELAGLGFAEVHSGQHTLVKVVTREGGQETHRITRITTVHWTDAAGQERHLQFVSLQGHHRRQPPEAAPVG